MVSVPQYTVAHPVPIRTDMEADEAGQSHKIGEDRTPGGPTAFDRIGPRIKAMLQVARYHGVELDPNEFRATSEGSFPTASDLSQWAQDAGMWSRALRIRW